MVTHVDVCEHTWRPEVGRGVFLYCLLPFAFEKRSPLNLGSPSYLLELSGWSQLPGILLSQPLWQDTSPVSFYILLEI